MGKLVRPDFDWTNHIWKWSSKFLFQYCKNSCDDLLYIRAIRGHTGGEVIAPELMGHVAIPIEWKEFLFHRGYSFNTNPRYGTHRSGKESKEGRQTVFFTPLDPWRDETEEEFDSDLFKSRTVHYQSKWKYSQDVVYLIHVTKTQEKTLTFCKTRSHVIIVHDSVSADCIEKMVSENGETILQQRLSTSRSAPRIILKSVWNSQHQQQQQ